MMGLYTSMFILTCASLLILVRQCETMPEKSQSGHVAAVAASHPILDAELVLPETETGESEQSGDIDPNLRPTLTSMEDDHTPPPTHRKGRPVQASLCTGCTVIICFYTTAVFSSIDIQVNIKLSVPQQAFPEGYLPPHHNDGNKSMI